MNEAGATRHSIEVPYWDFLFVSAKWREKGNSKNVARMLTFMELGILYGSPLSRIVLEKAQEINPNV